MVSSVLALTEPLRVELSQPSHDPKLLELLAPDVAQTTDGTFVSVISRIALV